MSGLGIPTLFANVNSFDDIGSGPLGAPPMRLSAYRRRRKTKRTKRMRGSGKKRGRTKKCKCGPKCKSCGKYNCKKGRSCKCPPGCGKRRTRGGCGSRKIKGGAEGEEEVMLPPVAASPSRSSCTAPVANPPRGRCSSIS